MNTFISMLGTALIVAFIIMSALWLIQRRTNNAGIVDIGWSGTIPLLAIVYAIWMNSCGSMRTILALIMAVLWGGRLVWHIHRRSMNREEDSRYAELRKSWGRDAQWKLFVFFQFQAAAAVLFSLPFLIAICNENTGVSGLEMSAFILWIIAWGGECGADRQLVRFKRDPNSKGKVCDIGYWKYSRHPNYFFEWLIWCALAIFCWPSPHGYLAIICPLLMLFFLFKVTGIPATEKQALKSKGDAYRIYQQTTSAFVPWFKKRNKHVVSTAPEK